MRRNVDLCTCNVTPPPYRKVKGRNRRIREKPTHDGVTHFMNQGNQGQEDVGLTGGRNITTRVMTNPEPSTIQSSRSMCRGSGMRSCSSSRYPPTSDPSTQKQFIRGGCRYWSHLANLLLPAAVPKTILFWGPVGLVFRGLVADVAAGTTFFRDPEACGFCNPVGRSGLRGPLS